jgi:hypothetical protein
MSSRNVEKSTYRLKFLKIENEETRLLLDSAQIEFINRVKQLHHDLNVYDEALDKPFADTHSTQPPPREEKSQSHKHDSDYETSENYPDLEVEKKEPPADWAKKLYRKIVVLTHPDKIRDDVIESERESLLASYNKSSRAYRERDYSVILSEAVSLNVQIPEIPEILDEIFKMCNDIEKDTAEMKMSDIWVWHHSSEEDKKRILYEYIKERGWTSHRASAKKSRQNRNPGKSFAWARKKLSGE